MKSNPTVKHLTKHWGKDRLCPMCEVSSDWWVTENVNIDAPIPELVARTILCAAATCQKCGYMVLINESYLR